VALGIFANQGEVCAAGSRILVARSVHAEFVERLAARAAAVVPGDPFIYRRGSREHPNPNAALGAAQPAMAYLLAAPAQPPARLPTALAEVLALCALVHARRLRNTRYEVTSSGRNRILVTLPHTGTLVTTAAMAWALATT
jgi:Aldehyde dehydrogenase family